MKEYNIEILFVTYFFLIKWLVQYYIRLISIITNIYCYIKLDLEKNSFENIEPFENNPSEFSNIIQKLLLNELKVNIYIGTPSQKIDLYFSMIKNDLIFVKKEKSKSNLYSPEKSYSFKFFQNSTFYNQLITDLIPSKDIITFDFYSFHNGKVKKITLLKKEILFYLDNSTNSNLIGSLGLAPYHIVDEDEKNINIIPSFLIQLKKYGIICKNTWFINLESNNNEIIFGLLPHEYNKNKYNEHQIVNLAAIPFKSRINNKIIFNWNFRISKMYVEFNNKRNNTVLDLTNEMSIDLNYNSELIISIQKYWSFINNVLFQEYIDNKKCFMNITNNIYNSRELLNSQYYYIYCNYKYKDELKNNFGNVVIECKDCNYTFKLTFEDLMKPIKVINNMGKEEIKLLFLVVFNSASSSVHHYHRWIMGSPFLKKYQFYFEQNSKMIYFYKKEISDKYVNKSAIKNNYLFDYKIIYILLLSFFVVLFFTFSLVVGRKLSKNKEKDKKNEIEMKDYKDLIDKE